ncbi:copia-type polyprotein [Cucumis melo var. makuwa]|uniref:Copia-type polyprotein n=1 Tax=Cucumis melo var. makuwa TaxID=1194695 RepID=A0A5A7UB17_CUCMM|nr:copia-type polyprotein [Cucumis melo var. makuwa]TYK19224.1 copia-type polyprotein [Cucumis melo var. makuwa]
MFKTFKSLVEKESGHYIKALRSDKGGKFTSNEFKTFYAKNGMRQPMIDPFTPQQNGVVERKSRPILNMARSTLKSKKMPKEFWAQVVECAMYLSNRSPTRSFWNKTSQQAWTGRKPSIAHLRVFGCMAYAHIPDQKRSKLDDKSQNMFLLARMQAQKATSFIIMLQRRRSDIASPSTPQASPITPQQNTPSSSASSSKGPRGMRNL